MLRAVVSIGQLVQTIVHIGDEQKIKAEDAMLYDRDINVGDQVYFDEDNRLEKVLDNNRITSQKVKELKK